MSIYKKPETGIYYFNFWWNGKHIQRSTRQRNATVARQMEAALRTKLARGEVGLEQMGPAPRFTAYAVEFLSGVKDTKKPKTLKCYESCVNTLTKEFGGKRLDQITAGQIERYKLKRVRAGYSPSTANRDLAVLRRMFRLAMKSELISKNPFTDGAVEFLKEKGRERILTTQEEQRYLTAASPLLKDIATLMLETGLRPGELFRIRKGNVNLRERWVYIPEGKTEKAERTVFLTDTAHDVLQRRIRNAQGSYLFPKKRGRRWDWNQPMTSIQKAHEKALTNSKIKPSFRLYDLRHTYGTHAIESGMDPLTLCQLMGHADLKTTQRYVHLSKKHLAEAQQRFQEYRMRRVVEDLAIESEKVR